MRIHKRISFVLLVGFFVMSALSLTPIGSVEAQTDYHVTSFSLVVDGESIHLETPILVINNRSMLPMRSFFETLQAQVQWISATRTAVAVKDGKTIEIPIGSRILKVDGSAVVTDTPAKLINNRTNIPVRVAAESLGYDVVFQDGIVVMTYSGETPPDDNKTDENELIEARVVELVNKEREKAGLEPLVHNRELSRVARYKSADMIENEYFSHTSPTYGSPFDMMEEFGIAYRAAGENIAYGYRTPESVMEGWMNSDGHRKNILSSNYTEIGVGYVVSENGTPYWTQMFIGR